MSTPPLTPPAPVSITRLACGTQVQVIGHGTRTAKIVGYEFTAGILYYFVDFDDIVNQYYPYTTLKVHHSEVKKQ